MSVAETLAKSWEFNRGRTVALLESIEKEADPLSVLGWQPGPDRAHIGWQLMHIGVTEEIFVTRLTSDKPGRFAELWPRFRGGSAPDNDVPSPQQIREILTVTRAELLESLKGLRDDQLMEVPESLKERGWRVIDALHIIGWHEGHHQGQAHITYNLNKASRGLPAGK